MDVIREYERIVEQRAEEARVAEIAAMGAMAAKRKAEAERASAAERRARLADELEAVQTLLDAARARLGDVRGEAAKTERQVELHADRAVEGDEKVAAVIARLQDSAAVQQALLRSHQKKVLDLEGRAELAECALRDHDAAVAASAGQELERLAAIEAAGVDQLLGRVAARSAVLFAAIDARRSVEVNGVRCREAWNHGLRSAGDRHQSLARCFAAAIRSLEPQYSRTGTATAAVTMSGLLQDAIQSWRGSAPGVEAA
jgi:hypothetical protein